jgi:replicative DNA helicase
MSIDIAKQRWNSENLSENYNDTPLKYSNYKSQQKLKDSSRVEPFSNEAEMAILGAILISSENLRRVLDIIKDETPFYNTKHRYIFRAMLSAASKSETQEASLLSVKFELENMQKLQEIGGEQYLMHLQSNSPKTIDILPYAQVVLDKAKSRMLLEACEQITHFVYHPNKLSTQEIIDLAESKMFNVNEQTLSKGIGPVSISEPLRELFNKIKDNRPTAEGEVTGQTTGYRNIDKMTSGFHPGQLIIIAARPAMGKTTFAMNLVENIIMNNDKPALVFSLEMQAIELAARLLASLARVDQNKIRNCDLDVNDWQNIAVVLKRFTEEDKSKSIFIDDQSSLTPLDIRTRARRLAKEYGGLSVVMVDYLQLMHAPGYGDNRALEVAECSRSLKALAKELKVPVLALAQLNRGLEGRKDKRPMPSDLRESGSIEQDADVILFVHREEVYNQNDPDLQGRAEIIIGKNRSGETGKCDMTFLKRYSRFEVAENIRIEE